MFPKTLSLLVLLVLGCVNTGCSADVEERPDAPELSANPSEGFNLMPAAPQACEHGTVSECKIYLASHAGVTTCVSGLKWCDGGRYGACMEAEQLEAYIAEPPSAAVEPPPEPEDSADAELIIDIEHEQHDSPALELPAK